MRPRAAAAVGFLAFFLVGGIERPMLAKAENIRIEQRAF